MEQLLKKSCLINKDDLRKKYVEFRKIGKDLCIYSEIVSNNVPDYFEFYDILLKSTDIIVNTKTKSVPTMNDLKKLMGNLYTSNNEMNIQLARIISGAKSTKKKVEESDDESLESVAIVAEDEYEDKLEEEEEEEVEEELEEEELEEEEEEEDVAEEEEEEKIN